MEYFQDTLGFVAGFYCHLLSVTKLQVKDRRLHYNKIDV